jgi:MFS family permease
MRGRTDEARELLVALTGRAQADQILSQYQSDSATRELDRVSLLQPQIFRLVLTACALAILQQIVGINAIIYHGVKLMMLLMPGTGLEAAFFHQVLIGLALFLATFISVALVDYWGRKRLWLIGAFGLAASIFTVGAAIWANAGGPWLLGIILLYIVFFGSTLGPLTWVMLPELAPDAVRSRLVGIAAMCNWMTNALVSQTFPMIDASIVNRVRLHGALPFLLYGIGSIAAFLFVWLWVPETKGVALVADPTDADTLSA